MRTLGYAAISGLLVLLASAIAFALAVGLHETLEMERTTSGGLSFLVLIVAAGLIANRDN